jgi:hypothetical protein
LKSKLWGGVCALVACLSSPAFAADWWWVSGEPEDAAITFVDAESLAQGVARAVSVDRTGAVTPRTVAIDCAKPADTAVQRFACASEDERMNSYAMLGGLDPRAAALALFASGKKEGAVTPRRRVSTLKVAEV